MDATRKKNVLFFCYYCVIIFLMCFPGPFDWANRIEPWVLGIPFSSFYLFLCSGLICAGLIFQYFVEGRSGELDIDVELLESIDLETERLKNNE